MKQCCKRLIAKLPWGHNLRVLDRIKDRPTREWYLEAALECGWSQDVLVLQIKSGLHEREGKALTNFQRPLPPLDSALAEQVLKDPYNFDFLTVSVIAKEREVERGLLNPFAICSSSWVAASPSSEAKSHSWSMNELFISTCFSITSASIVILSSN